jgi:predicted HD phosphohydrolase
VPITFIDRNGPPEAMRCPAFLCDVCNEPVHHSPDDGHFGAVVWWTSYDGDRPKVSQVYVVHKGPQKRCLDALSKAIGKDAGHETWDNLDSFAQQLLHNALNPFVSERDAQYIAPHPSTWTLGSR